MNRLLLRVRREFPRSLLCIQGQWKGLYPQVTRLGTPQNLPEPLQTAFKSEPSSSVFVAFQAAVVWGASLKRLQRFFSFSTHPLDVFRATARKSL